MPLRRLLHVALLVGCGDALEPANVLGTYSLVTIQGEAPPRTVLDEPDCRVTVVGGTLTLGADDHFELVLDEVTVCPTPTAPGEVGESWLGTFNIDGDAVALHALGDPSVDSRAELHDGRLIVPLGSRHGDVGFARDGSL
jgi:hypothetical protein